jgi:hypothetical protein
MSHLSQLRAIHSHRTPGHHRNSRLQRLQRLTSESGCGGKGAQGRDGFVVTTPIRGSLRPTKKHSSFQQALVLCVLYSGGFLHGSGSASCVERPHELSKPLREGTKTLQLVINAGFRHDYDTQATKSMSAPPNRDCSMRPLLHAAQSGQWR